jgi:hypothetical protein
MIVKVVGVAVPFGVTDVGLKVAVECAGKPLTLNVTGLVKPLAVGVIVIWIVACWPALTDGGVAGPATV